MLQVWDDIRGKALKCIDETYPDSDNANAAFFPVDDFMLEAARWIIGVVPAKVLGAGAEIPTDKLDAHADGSGSLPLPADFMRLIAFRMKGWLRPVTEPIYDTDIRYAQQFNRTLRGGEARPVVVISRGGTRLEYFSSTLGEQARIVEARYMGLPTTEGPYPEKLKDITAWKLAELILSCMNDLPAAQLCAAKVNEHLQTL